MSELNLKEERRRMDSLLRQLHTSQDQLVKEQDALKLASFKLNNAKQAQSYIQEIAQEVQSQAHKQISKVVSKCLSSVFEKPYRLQIEFERKRGRTEASFVYYREGHKIDPRTTSGGVLGVAALALRLASIMMSLPPPQRFLCLDEPFRGLSSKNLSKMAVLIDTLSEQMGVQMLITTHDTELQLGKVINLDSQEAP